MRKSLYRYLVLGTLMLICAVPMTGRATLTTWTLDDVRVSGTTARGTLTGWFSFDDAARAVTNFNLHGDILFSGTGPLSFELVPFSPSCTFGSINCALATVDSMSNITFFRPTSPASFIRIVLDPDGPLTGDRVQLTTGFVEDAPTFTRIPSYISGPPYSSSAGAISGALLVPEPSSYLALLVGFGFLGLILRRSALRRRSDRK